MKFCALCNDPATKYVYVTELDAYLCNKHYLRHKAHKKLVQHELPIFGEVKFDEAGNPICHVCGYAYRKVLSHVAQVHGMTADEYKREYGLFTSKGICNEETRAMLREAVSDHFDLVVRANLIKRGIATRFNKGGEGRTREKMSEQLRRQLVARNKNLRPDQWVSVKLHAAKGATT